MIAIAGLDSVRMNAAKVATVSIARMVEVAILVVKTVMQRLMKNVQNLIQESSGLGE